MNKRKCVLGVLKTEAGLKIKEEMLAWLSPIYEVFCVEQEAPGVLYEYPAIKMAADLAVDLDEPVLYLHTKGAAMPNQAQPMVRAFWQHEFTVNSEKYFEMVNENKPLVSAPYTMKRNIAWFNAFVMNPIAAKWLLTYLKPQSDRYWFEQQLWNHDSTVTMLGLYDDMVSTFSDPWPAFVYLFNGVMNMPVQNNKKMNIAVVAIAKDEERYIEEWLNYYRKLGVNHFYIFDNNDVGNDKLPTLLNSHKDVTIIDVRGPAKLSTYGYQAGCYKMAYDKHSEEYDYMGFFDIDEFLYLNDKTIPEWLTEHKEFDDTDVIKFNWLYYGDNGLVHYDNRPVQERFPHPCPPETKYAQNFPECLYCKALIKCGKEMVQHIIHSAIIKNGICKNAEGRPENIGAGQVCPPSFKNGFIKHYGTKTVEEYVEKRCKNTGWAVNANHISAEDRIKWFFNVNEDTEEKRNTIKEMLNEKV